jgi:hypothetical protein
MSRSDPFNAEFYKTFEEALPTLFKLFWKKLKKWGFSYTHFMRPVLL